MASWCLKTVFVALGLAAGSIASAQGPVFYTFDPIIDGELWPDSPPGLLPDDYHVTNEHLGIANWTTNNLFFDDNYQAAGNSGRIDGPAIWGNPRGFDDTIQFDFLNTFEGYVNSVSFDFAWATAGGDAPTELEIFIFDSQGNSEYVVVPLEESFQAGGVFGGFYGATAHVTVPLVGSLQDIEQFGVYVGEIGDPGGTSEYAIDNFSIDGGGSGSGPSNLDVDGIVGISSNSIRRSGTSYLAVDVRNTGADLTNYSVIITGDFYDADGQVGLAIAGGEVISPGAKATINTNMLSGKYSGSMDIVNNGNPDDPTETVVLNYSIWDVAQLTSDAGTTVDPAVDGGIFISNAPPLGHAGALRAAVRVTGVTVTGSGFGVSGIAVGDEVRAGQTRNALVTFDASGMSPGTYTGTLTVSLEMGSVNDQGNFSFLNGKPNVPDIVWNLSTQVGQTSDEEEVAAGEDFGDAGIAVSNGQTAAALVGGTSSTVQTVSMALTTDPTGGTYGLLAGTPINLDLGAPGDRYVLAFTYQDAQLPSGFDEADLRVLTYDALRETWLPAVQFNSDGGAGESFFLGSFAAFEATLGGGPLPLSKVGVDPAGNQVWAVLDHNSLFGAGIPASLRLLGDVDADGEVSVLDIVSTVVAFGAKPGDDLWDPRADWDADDEITVLDVVTVVTQFGTVSG